MKLGGFMSIGSKLLDIKCLINEWIWRYKVPAFDTSVPMKLACYCITSLLSFWSICIQSFPKFFTLLSFKMVFFFFLRFFPFLPLPVELELLFPPPPVLIKKRSIFHCGFFHMPRLIINEVLLNVVWLTDLTRAAVHVVRLHVHDTVVQHSTNTAIDSHVHLLQWLWIFKYCVESTNFE